VQSEGGRGCWWGRGALCHSTMCVCGTRGEGLGGGELVVVCCMCGARYEGWGVGLVVVVWCVLTESC
jgi:hypothetical protein